MSFIDRGTLWLTLQMQLGVVIHFISDFWGVFSIGADQNVKNAFKCNWTNQIWPTANQSNTCKLGQCLCKKKIGKWAQTQSLSLQPNSNLKCISKIETGNCWIWWCDLSFWAAWAALVKPIRATAHVTCDFSDLDLECSSVSQQMKPTPSKTDCADWFDMSQYSWKSVWMEGRPDTSARANTLWAWQFRLVSMLDKNNISREKPYESVWSNILPLTTPYDSNASWSQGLNESKIFNFLFYEPFYIIHIPSYSVLPGTSLFFVYNLWVLF